MGAGPDAGGKRVVGGRAGLLRLAVGEDAADLSAAVRGGTGVCLPGGDDHAVQLRRDDLDRAGELQREPRLREWAHGGVPGTDGAGGWVPVDGFRRNGFGLYQMHGN